MIPFNKPSVGDLEIKYVEQSIQSGLLSGGGIFSEKVQSSLKEKLSTQGEVLLTTSCTHSLEIAAILLDLKPGDEVIVPAYTFPTTALAFVMHGANLVFADSRADTFNIDENKLTNLITDKTKAIVPVHYAGVACEMDTIMAIASFHDLVVIEDNAHGLFGRYKGRALGTIGHLSCQSFHETKNLSCGEGGALVINDTQYLERAEIILEKGTNRKRFFRGQVDKYSWVDKGSSYVLADILAALLYAQLNRAEEIQRKRKALWDNYYNKLSSWADVNNVRLPFIPVEAEQAFHMFYLVMPTSEGRDKLIAYLNKIGINAVFHYLPLNSSEMGMQYVKPDSDPCKTAKQVSERIVRIPFYTDMKRREQEFIVNSILEFKVNF